MALFKISKGPSSNLDKQEKNPGYVWVTEDEHAMYVDLSDTERIKLYDNLENDIKSAINSLNNKTNTSIMPNDSGDVKTKYRVAQKGNSSTATWYYPLCEFPINNAGNYASVIVSGRLGGWTSDNMSYINALVWNRENPGIATIDLGAKAGTSSTIYNMADLVLYVNGASLAAAATATLYAKCSGYFVFDLNLELFQSNAKITYDGSYLIATPSGTLVAQASTTTQRVEIINGKLSVGGKEFVIVNEGNAGSATKLKNAVNINGTPFDGSADITTTKWGAARTIQTRDSSSTNTSKSITWDGSNNIQIYLPDKIKAEEFTGALVGNAKTADSFSSNKTITLTGDISGSGAGTSGWSITTTLADSGVTAGGYGPTSSKVLSWGETFTVPYVKVDKKGRVTTAMGYGITLPKIDAAERLGTVDVGNSTTPIYLSKGTATACSGIVVTTGAQTFSGNKTFSGDITGGGNITLTAGGLIAEKGTVKASQFQGSSAVLTGTVKANNFTGTSLGSQNIELNNFSPILANSGGFIDFHYHNANKKPTDTNGNELTAEQDYTSRIIENAPGTIDINGVKFKNNIATGSFKGSLAGNADTATKATQDGNGKVISDTYETKSDASNKLIVAKKYTDDSISPLSTKVNILIGSDLNKSVRTIANEELAAQLIPESAQASLDTLQEIAAWIQQHPDDAAAMNVEISKKMDKAGGTFTGLVKFNEVDGQCINFDKGFYINKSGGQTLLGNNGSTTWIGMNSAALVFRGTSGVRPTYNGVNLALQSDISAHAHSVGTGLTISGTGGISGTVTYSANLKSTTSLGALDTTSKLYAVGVDDNGQLCVNVPWKNTHYTTKLYAGASGTAANAAATNPYIKVIDSSTYRNQIQLKGAGATAVSSDANGVITITSTNTTYSSLKNPYSLTIQTNGTSQGSYDGSAAKSINITYSNVGAAAASHTHTSLVSLGAQTPETGRTSSRGGIYTYNTNASVTGGPTTYTSIIGFGQGTSGHTEIASCWTSGRGLWYRNLRDTIDDWFSWCRVLDETNYTSYTVTKTGSGASGTWGIGISGNAATATTANKLGTNAGSSTLPVYFSGGIPVACSSTLGVSITGNAATATKLGTSTVGGTAKPIYLNAGAATACSATVGSSNEPVYMNGGTITACTMSTSGNRWGVLPQIGTDGVMEVGKYIDFHGSGGATSDYAVRLTADSNLLTVSGKLSLPTNDYTWLAGGTTMTGAAININTAQSSSLYHPVLNIKTSSGHYISQGGLGNNYGFYGYLASRTENGKDWYWQFSSASGLITHNSSVSDGARYALQGTGDVCFTVQNTNTSCRVGLLLGSGGYNRGIYDFTNSNWAFYVDSNAKYHVGPSGVYALNSVLYGACWNDYAEYRSKEEIIEPGYCVASRDNGKIYKTTEKFQACDGIISDTYGFVIGDQENESIPLAVAGRVLAYCEGDRYSYHAGDTVCAGSEGKVIKMSREEICMWPDRIVGIVSEIPEYETWGENDIEVNGRIWIKVR